MKVLKTFAALAVLGAMVWTPADSFAAQKYDNFVLLIDQSMDMHVNYHQKSKNHIARRIGKRFLSNVPTTVPIKGAIYMYGIMASENENRVARVQKMAAFNYDTFKREFENKVAKQNGPSTLSQAIRTTRHDLEAVPGRTAVIIVSGGNFTDVDDPVQQARKLKQTYGPNVCIYTVLVGNSKKGGKLLREVVDKGKCGFPITSDGLERPEEMKRWVSSIFLGATGDKDMDGVADSSDKCPNTPPGAYVDSRGCWSISDINFDVGKSDIKPIYYPLIDSVASVMNANPDMQIMIEGHTDSDGDDMSNLKLSQERAMAVMNYMIQAEVDPGRMRAAGMGEGQPIASNSTPQGKAMNRRIEFKIQ